MINWFINIPEKIQERSPTNHETSWQVCYVNNRPMWRNFLHKPGISRISALVTIMALRIFCLSAEKNVCEKIHRKLSSVFFFSNFRIALVPVTVLNDMDKIDPDHYSDAIMSMMASQMTGYQFFTQPFVQAQMKENIKALRHWPLWGEFTGDRWIPRTKGQ